MANEYNESSIKVLKNLEPIKKRPGMYTRTESPTHMVTELIDNAIDEALAGHAKNIEVIMYLDGSMSVSDNGRGIPCGIHPTEQIHTLNVIFQMVHSGGKFENDSESGSYQISAGLHGVGVSLTNALSNKLEVKVKRGGQVHQAIFENGETVLAPEVVGKCAKSDTGTYVRSWPNPKYFDSPNISRSSIQGLLKAKSIFLPHASIVLKIENESGFETFTWTYENGLLDYLNKEIIHDADPLGEPLYFSHVLPEATEHNMANEGIETAFVWSTTPGRGASFTNLVPNRDGGTHENGLREVVFAGIKSFAETHGLNHKSIRLTPEDVWSNLNFVIHAKMVVPAFASQTKDRLSSKEAVKLVATCLKDPFSIWLHNNVQLATEITKLCISNAISRTKTEKPIERKKSSGVSLLPGKLSDAEIIGPESELYLVEGDSAGGSARQARNKINQGILALKGKSLNTWEVASTEILGNAEVNNMAVSIGLDPHTREDKIDLSQLRYGRIILLADADVDGLHIQSLIMTLFMRHFPQLLLNGHVYIAHPPLYIISVQAHGKMPFRQLYAADNSELDRITQSLADQKVSKEKIHVSYLKGLGEMDPINLYESTLNPSVRRLSKLLINDWDKAMETFNIMMAEKQVEARKKLISNFKPE